MCLLNLWCCCRQCTINGGKKFRFLNEPLSNWKMNVCNVRSSNSHMWELGIEALQSVLEFVYDAFLLKIQLISLKWVSSQTDRFLSFCRAHQISIFLLWAQAFNVFFHTLFYALKFSKAFLFTIRDLSNSFQCPFQILSLIQCGQMNDFRKSFTWNRFT